MKISRFFVYRPIFTSMVMLIIIILGLVSFTRLPIDLMPDITYPTLSISTSYENAAPEEIEELVSRPIEEAMSAVPGVEEVSSMSMQGSSNVRVTFSWGTDLDAAANDMRDRLDRAMGRLPDDADRPRLRKFDPSAFPILIMGASGDMDQMELRRIIDDEVKYRIERVPGVAALDIWGGLDREIQVNFYPDKIKALGLSLPHIVNQIKASNTNIPGGSVEQGNLEISIRTPGEFENLDDLRNTVIATRDNAPIKLGDIAEVTSAWEKITRIVRINGKEGIRLSVTKQSGTNTVEVARKVLKELEIVNEDIPQITLVPIIDTSEYIQRSISNVGMAALWGGILAMFVLFFFLRNFLSTIIVSTAIPISIIATFALIYFNGYTLNIMSLGGLALGVGMMVDSSIVVLENIHRLREGGKGDKDAAVEGTEEVTAAIIAGTLTTISVFAPMIFIRGMAGVMFKQLAVIVSFALITALFTALTLIPMLSSRIHKISKKGNNSTNKHNKIYKISERFFNRMEETYKKLLDYALYHRKYVVIGGVLLIIGSISLIPLVGVELMPAADEGEVRVYGEMEVGTRLTLLDEKFKPIEKLVNEQVPEIKNSMTRLGGSSWRGGGGHEGQMRVALVPKNQRSRSSDEIALDLRKKLSKIPGMSVRTRAGQGLFILRMGTGGEERLEIEIRGYDLKTAEELTGQVKKIVENADGITDVRLSRESGSPEDLIIIDREKAADLNLTVSDIANSIQTILRGSVAGYYREGGKEYPIRVKLYGSERMSKDELLDMTITNNSGQSIILRNVITTRPSTAPVQIDRKDQERIITVSANISGERDMGHIVDDIKEQLKSLAIPRDFTVGFGGEMEEQRKAFGELLLSLILALVLVYMVMACLYESLVDPFIVMFSVPMAIIGVVLMLFLTNTTFNIQSYIGCIMLGGIVVNNAILLVDHTNLLRRRDGMPLREAIEEAGRRRLRPILMTSLTTMLALIPLAIGIGEGGEAQAPLARAVIGGLLSSTIITLIFIPTVYSVVEGVFRKKS